MSSYFPYPYKNLKNWGIVNVFLFPEVYCRMGMIRRKVQLNSLEIIGLNFK